MIVCTTHNDGNMNGGAGGRSAPAHVCAYAHQHGRPALQCSIGTGMGTPWGSRWHVYPCGRQHDQCSQRVCGLAAQGTGVCRGLAPQKRLVVVDLKHSGVFCIDALSGGALQTSGRHGPALEDVQTQGSIDTSIAILALVINILLPITDLVYSPSDAAATCDFCDTDSAMPRMVLCCTCARHSWVGHARHPAETEDVVVARGSTCAEEQERAGTVASAAPTHPEPSFGSASCQTPLTEGTFGQIGFECSVLVC